MTNNSNWNNPKNKNDIIDDIKRAINTIRNNTDKLISIRESLYHNNNILTLAGYSPTQINYYNKLVLNAYKKQNEKHNNK